MQDTLSDDIIDDDIPLQDDIPAVDDTLEDLPTVADDHLPIHATREEWLTAATALLRPQFSASGHALPAALRVAMGFPSTANRSGTLGETWADTASRDKTIEVLISPVLDDPRQILEVLIAQIAHAVPGALNHGTTFRKVAHDMDLEPLSSNYKSLRGSDRFLTRYQGILEALGKYPHAALVPTNLKQKQQTRLLKVQCTDPACGYTVRITEKWLRIGIPSCCCGAGEMTRV